MQSTQQSQTAIGVGGAMGPRGRSNAAPDVRVLARQIGCLVVVKRAMNLPGWIGFDGKFAGKLFGVFQQRHRADEFDGTGIGWPSVRRKLVRHGGRIWTDAGTTGSFALAPTSTGRPAPSAQS